MPAQIEHYLVIMQLPIVLLLFIFNAQAVKAFAETNFRFVAAGWLANFGYLLFGHASKHPDDEVFSRLAHDLPASELARVFNVLTLLFFLFAARRFFRARRPELLLARCPEIALFGGFAALLALEVTRSRWSSFSTLLHVPAVLIGVAALSAVAIIFDDTLRPRESDRRSKSRLLLVGGTLLYALIQPLAVVQGNWPETLGFTLGFLSKTLMVVGLVGGFVMSAEAAARTEAVRRRLGEVARTIGRITHELGTPIRLLDNQVTALIRVAPSHGDFARQLEGIDNTVLRIDAVIDATLTLLPNPDTLIDVGMLANPATTSWPERVYENVNINTLVQLAVMAVKETRGERVFVRRSFAGHCCVYCVPFEVVQIIINVLRNAYDAVPSGSTGHVSVSTRAADAGCVLVSILDDGHGIPAEFLNKIFDDGITTRHGPGRGYGMGVIRQLTQSNGGAVIIESPFEKHSTTRPGTNVVISFPRVKCLTKEERRDQHHVIAPSRHR